MNYYHDSLNRLYKRAVGAENNQITNQYYYTTTTGTDGITYYSNQLNREVIEGISYNFSYDGAGNIKKITKAIGEASAYDYRTYEYDVLDRLVVEKNNTNKQVVTYTYNHLGNITQKQIDTYTNTTLTGTPTTKVITYNYGNDGKTGWNYLLTSYDADSDGVVDTNERILYDGIGNPLTYRGATLAWYGRQLRSFTKNGITSTMTYDADGLRSSKTVAGVKTEYQYVGDKLFYEKRGDGNSFYYFYDSYGKLSAIYHHKNGDKTAYHVVTNAQGDVIALYSWTGTKVAEYSYDAWGNCTIVSDTSGTGIATLNPFRYRSYYYDKDLGLYYLQSRYYDSEIGRFINADNQISVVGGNVMGNNLFSYCFNNPVNNTDASGMWTISILIGANGNLGLGLSGSIGFSFDSKGNFEWQYNYIVPGVDDTASIGCFDIGAGIAIQTTNAPTVYDLHGLGTTVGLGTGYLDYATIDIVSLSPIDDIINDADNGLGGIQVAVGVGAGIDIHVNQSMTKPLIDNTTTYQEVCDLMFDILESIPFINQGG